MDEFVVGVRIMRSARLPSNFYQMMKEENAKIRISLIRNYGKLSFAGRFFNSLLSSDHVLLYECFY